MQLSPQDWHHRFTLQSTWTRNTREYLYSITGIKDSHKVLDLGCGSGVITAELAETVGGSTFGLDINLDILEIAAQTAPAAVYSAGDAHFLPFKSSTFDFCICHYLLLWLKEPLFALREMMRVTTEGGAVLILAEPDYGGRIDYPHKFEIISEWQTTSLENQGANPLMGRELRALLQYAGFTNIEVGVIGALWNRPPSQAELRSEWEIIEFDYEYLDKPTKNSVTLEKIKAEELAAWAIGERIVYVPTFYAWGRIAK